MKPALPGSDDVQHRRPGQPAQHLGDDVGHQILRREAASGDEPDGHGRVEVAARDVADGVGHRQHRQAEGEGHAEEADADVEGSALELGAERPHARTALPQPPNTSQNVPMNSATPRFQSSMEVPSWSLSAELDQPTERRKEDNPLFVSPIKQDSR